MHFLKTDKHTNRHAFTTKWFFLTKVLRIWIGEKRVIWINIIGNIGNLYVEK